MLRSTAGGAPAFCAPNDCDCGDDEGPGVGEPAAATGSTTASLEAGGEENLTLKDKLKQLEAQLRDKEDEVKPTSVGADDMFDPPPLP